MWNKFGFKTVIKYNKFVLSKGRMFVGKNYYRNAMFKLNGMPINRNNNKSTTFAYLLQLSSMLWHNRLEHVNYQKLHDDET